MHSNNFIPQTKGKTEPIIFITLKIPPEEDEVSGINIILARFGIKPRRFVISVKDPRKNPIPSIPMFMINKIIPTKIVVRIDNWSL